MVWFGRNPAFSQQSLAQAERAGLLCVDNGEAVLLEVGWSVDVSEEF